MRLIYPARVAKDDAQMAAMPGLCAFVWTLYKPSKSPKLDYMPGLIVSMYSARKRHELYNDLRFVVMVTPDVPESDLTTISKFADYIWRVPYITRPVTLGIEIAERTDVNQWINTCFTKFNALALPYKKIILLDCDTIILRSVVDLFTLDTPAACYAHMDHQPYGPAFNYYTRCGRVFPNHGEKIPTEAICEMIKNTYVFNGAVMVLTPSRLEFAEFIAMIDEFKFGFAECSSKPDEQAITMFYGKKNILFTNLNAVYNTSVFRHEYLGNESAQIMHFSGANKPWHRKYTGRIARWHQYAAACHSTGVVDLSPYTVYQVNRAVKIILRKPHIDKRRVNHETGECLAWLSSDCVIVQPLPDHNKRQKVKPTQPNGENPGSTATRLTNPKASRLIYDLHYAEHRRQQAEADKLAIAWCDAIFDVQY
jgi:lipopolysaccharide biosynthesis glycosyltransferase